MRLQPFKATVVLTNFQVFVNQKVASSNALNVGKRLLTGYYSKCEAVKTIIKWRIAKPEILECLGNSASINLTKTKNKFANLATVRHTAAMNSPAFSRVAPPLLAAWQRALDALFPPRCGACREFSGPIFCARCASELIEIVEPCCQSCGRVFDPLALGDEICAQCRAHPPAFERARACWIYHGPPRLTIHRFKYNRRYAMAPRLARPMAHTPAARALLWDWQPDCLVPVALHASRARARGFNQSALLARELGLLCEVPALELLKRTRRTPPQVGLDLKARRANVRAAFEVDANLWQRENLKGARILLIDDVFTTGATLNECARVLNRAGAGAVAALTVARQQRPDEPLPREPNFVIVGG